MTPLSITRREFLAFGALGSAGALTACGVGTTLSPGQVAFLSRPSAPTSTITTGLHDLQLDFARDAQLYVPSGYRSDKPVPLVVLLHGAGRTASEWTSPQTVKDLLNEFTIAMLAPTSRDLTWFPGGADVAFIDLALDWTFRRLNVDPAYLAMGGFSDGASVGLSLGIGNGSLFPHLFGFSPGYLQAPRIDGKPRIFVSHGRDDQILSYDNAVSIVNSLRGEGYNVEFVSFDGGHTVGVAVGRQAFEWLLQGRTG